MQQWSVIIIVNDKVIVFPVPFGFFGTSEDLQIIDLYTKTLDIGDESVTTVNNN